MFLNRHDFSWLLLAASSLALAHPVKGRRRFPTDGRLDLADMVAGRYVGDVTSDVQGASHKGVTVTVVRLTHNVVEIRCDYARIRAVRIPIELAGGAVVNATGQNTFLIERERDPSRLDLAIDGAPLILHKRTDTGQELQEVD